MPVPVILYSTAGPPVAGPSQGVSVMDSHAHKSRVVGRGAGVDPPNRFERVRVEDDFAQRDPAEEMPAERRVPTVFLPNDTRRLIAENDSPDVPFRYSINPYRGCEHGCAYCYARPGHETLGMNAGLDFETRILVKHDAPELLRRELAADGWCGEPITLSGVTDCYQPAEREYRLTRGCLEVMLEARQPLGIITKNALVTRDLDLLAPLAAENLVHVHLSVTTLDDTLARAMEPRTATPKARLRAISELSAAGVPVGVMTAPIIPGLNDQEIPAILAAAREAGARSAGYVLLRLPFAVRPIFEDWIKRNYPDKAERVFALIRSTRDGRMNKYAWGTRLRGEGPYADQIRQTFQVFRRKHGLDQPLPPLDCSKFAPPRPSTGQLRLF
jgi:DNA repair photolyase